MHINEAYEHEPILPYNPEDTCPGRNCQKNVNQCVDVSAKLTVAPTTNVGTAVVTCQGDPRVTCTNNAGGETVTVTVTQKVCFSVPICFGVTVTPDGPHIACHGDDDGGDDNEQRACASCQP